MRLLPKVGVLVFGLLLTASLGMAQQEKGDKEIGLAGSALVSHSSPVTGSGFLLGSVGYFLTQRHYLGFQVAPILSFGGGTTSVSGQFGANYRFLIGSGTTQKVWPFVGVGGGAFV